MKKMGPVAWVAAAMALSAASCGPPQGQEQPASLTVAVQTGPWQFADRPGQQLTSRHYRIFTTSNNRPLVRYMPGFMESAYEHYLRLTGLSEPPGPLRPMPVYLLANRQQWAVMTEEVTGPLREKFLAIENGGYCYRGVCVFWDLGHFSTFSIASHEGLHQFFHHRLRDGLPAWAEEGLCVLAEGFKISTTTVTFTPAHNPLREGSLRNAISARHTIRLAKLLSTDPGDYRAGSSVSPPEYYAHLWALMMFIRSEPPGAPVFIDEQYKREEIPKLWEPFDQGLARLTISYEKDTWMANPSPLCGWCPVSTCDFYKPTRRR